MPSKTQRKKTRSSSYSPLTIGTSMRNFLTRTDKAKSPPIKFVNTWGNTYGLAPRLTPEYEGRYKFKNPSSSERRKINKKYSNRAKTARSKLGVDKNLIPINFKLGGRRTRHNRY